MFLTFSPLLTGEHSGTEPSPGGTEGDSVFQSPTYRGTQWNFGFLAMLALAILELSVPYLPGNTVEHAARSCSAWATGIFQSPTYRGTQWNALEGDEERQRLPAFSPLLTGEHSGTEPHGNRWKAAQALHNGLRP